jgi:long-chain acyl-CoA synthetase
MMSHRALLAYLETLSAVAGMDDTTTALSTMPLFHIGGTGWALAAAYRGATTIQMRDVDPDLMLRAIERHRVTTLIAVPVVMRMLLQSPLAATADLSSLRTFYYGGGPMMQATLDAALKIFSCDFVQGFGMTECPLITALAPVDHLGAPGRLRSCGRPVRGTDVRLVDPGTGRDVPDGSVGEIVVRSPQLLAGYWNKPEAQRDSFLDGQWFRTGDAAFRDSEGYLYMQDRIKDMIVSGGENVYPAEVENVLALHPDVAECAVVGVPSDRWTETVKAVVVAASPTLTPQELIGFCKERLAGYKCPTTVDFVAALPRTPSGKVEKFRLRAACAR